MAHGNFQIEIYLIRWQKGKEMNRNGATSCGSNRRAPAVAKAGCARQRRVYTANKHWASLQTNIDSVITTASCLLASEKQSSKRCSRPKPPACKIPHLGLPAHTGVTVFIRRQICRVPSSNASFAKISCFLKILCFNTISRISICV